MAFDIAAFRVAFPQFSNVTIYPDALIQAQADIAECFLAANGCSCETVQMQLMVAHLLTLNDRIIAGTGTTGQIASATIDKVSVSITPPPGKSGFLYWLNTTPYGVQLAALLSVCAVGGLYVGGRPERAAFRSVGGAFPNGGRVS